MHTQRPRPPEQRGFTIVELMVTVAVVAILAGISVSSYRRYAMRANRTEARIALLAIQTGQEKWYLQNNQYAQALATLVAAPPAGLGIPIDATGLTTGGHYQVSFTAAAANAYTVQAVAVGTQVNDEAACRTYTVNQLGVFTPPQGNTNTCWR